VGLLASFFMNNMIFGRGEIITGIKT